MAIEKLTYGKSWENPADFPTYEPDEIQVRADMQYHPDAVRDYINDILLPSIEDGGAENVGATLPGGEAGSVQEALDALDGRTAANEEDIGTLQAHDADHEGRITALEGTAEAHGEELEDHEGRIAEIERGAASAFARDEYTGKLVRIWTGPISAYNALERVDPDVRYFLLEGTA